MSDFGITCGACGKTSDLFAWTSGQPKETYRCPACGYTFRREIGKPEVLKSRFIIPGKITIKEVPHKVG